jgi:hypothetical protein
LDEASGRELGDLPERPPALGDAKRGIDGLMDCGLMDWWWGIGHFASWGLLTRASMSAKTWKSQVSNGGSSAIDEVDWNT